MHQGPSILYSFSMHIDPVQGHGGPFPVYLT